MHEFTRLWRKLATRYGIKGANEEAMSRVYELGGGHPLYLRYLLETYQGMSLDAALEELEFPPPTIGQYIQRIYETLSLEEKAVLSQMCVSKQPVTYEEMAATIETKDLRNKLQRLVERGLIRYYTGKYDFTHELLREHICRNLSS